MTLAQILILCDVANPAPPATGPRASDDIAALAFLAELPRA